MSKVKLNDDYFVDTDKYQYLLNKRVAKKGDEIVVGKNKGGLVKNDRFETTYHPRLSDLLDNIIEEKIKDNIEVVNNLKDLNEFKNELKKEIDGYKDTLVKWYKEK